ncbi:MAG TPA: N,N-dimethylformamidase beta subunit family domain-containing protein, partial [Chitinophagaceae bacterium]|nr:N,N-dimethylformamidase beta subunit family domain-containing protein [Chitinophagaceae bacterium]
MPRGFRYLTIRRQLLLLFMLVASGLLYAQNPIVIENNLTGNPSSEWDIAGAGDLSIQGFATDISVNKGQTVHFKINTDAAAYTIDIYRLGYYNGMGARKVGTGTITATLPQTQPNPLTDLETGLVDCGNWAESASWSVPSNAVSGIYIAKLTRTDNGGASHIAFIVRDDASHSDMFFQTSDATWQAYNVYGGNSLYVGTTNYPNGHATKVSYNRPFITRNGGGGGGIAQDWLFNAEYPMIRFLERNGYDVTYTTNVDAARAGGLILNHKAFLSVGHDEYWSAEQRTNVEAARSAGVHLAFFSGNEIYWKTRWENSTDGSNTSYRTLVCYKEGSLGEAICGEKCDPSPVWTGLWREGCNYPGSGGCKPENALSGQISWRNGTGSISVPSTYKNLRFWRSTGVAALNNGEIATFPNGTLGNEWNFEQYPESYPAGRITMSSTTVSGQTHKLSLYRHASGALVFGAGTIQWAWGLDNDHDGGNLAPSQDMQQATVNLLADMGVQPATLMTGLTPAAQSTDTLAPASVITSPTHLQTIPDYVPITITGTASDPGGGVIVAVEISFDNGLTWRQVTGTTDWSYSWKPSGHSSYTIKVRGFDDSGNIEALGADGSANNITVDISSNLPPPITIFQPTDAPAVLLQNDNQGGVEVGTKFRSTADGSITALRFYKGAGNTGTHKGHLWTSTGTLLGEVTFTDETASGWQEAALSVPVGITANTTYIVSYFSPDGFYSFTDPYFASTVINGSLQGLAEGEDGHNGVLKFTPVPAFPDQSSQTINYWADVVFIEADIAPPLVSSIVPTSNAMNVNIGSSVQVVFNEPIDLTTVNASTFELRNASNTLIPATVSYNTVTRTATLTPSSNLSYISTYTVTLKGGTTGQLIRDLSNNALSSNYVYTFTSQFAPPQSPMNGPGGPILVISSTSNPFSRYPVEILRAEGLNEFATADISSITPTLLNDYDVIVLGEVAVDGSRATMLNNWVSAGGTLIAFRPDANLNTLFGLNASTGTLNDKYLLVNSGAGPGLGIVHETIQFHGSADLHTLTAGAISLATLYSDATTATTNPAISTRNVGSGKAIAFMYDLARSIVYTHQGNPDQAGVETDGVGPVRSDDQFFPDYLDMDKVQIPQADEQQRLLANIIIQSNLTKKPLPRLWYLPGGDKAAIVYTVDDHGTASGTTDIFNKLKANSPVGGSTATWTNFRATSWFYMGIPLTDSMAAVYSSEGFDMGVHVQNNCNDFTSFADLDASYTPQLNAFHTNYPSLPQQVTHRFHCIVWSDWLTQAKVELSHGIRYSMDYYYWPPQWINGRPGLFTGSGIPMRFGDLNGDILDVYQGVSQLVNENGVDYNVGVNTLLANALGPKGYYGIFGTHDDYRDTTFSTAVISAALANHVPIISARQALNWLDGRNNSAIGSISWNNNQLSFSVLAYSGAENLKTMLPLYSSNGQLSSITRNGNSINFTVETIKGIQYAFFDAPLGQNNFVATYIVDIVAPIISNIVATPNADGLSATITWTTNESSDSKVDHGIVANNLDLSATDNTPVTSHSIVLTGLVPGTTYHFRVSSKDFVGNTATEPAINNTPLNFTMPTVCASDVVDADFNQGTHDANTLTTLDGGGAVILKPALIEEFSGTTVPSDWGTGVFNPGSTTVSGGAVTVNGTQIFSNNSFAPGTSIEFVATFNLGFFQSVGLTNDQAFNTAPWVVIGQNGAPDGNLYARAFDGTTINIGTDLLGSPHRYRINWNADNFQIFVDGNATPAATIDLAVTSNMYIQISDVQNTSVDGVLTVDWIRASPYTSPGSFQSRVLDAGSPKAWGAVNWISENPAGTSLGISVRTGNTPVPDGTWSAFNPISTSGTWVNVTSRYIQYRADLATTDVNYSPVLKDISINCADPVSAPVVTTQPSDLTVCANTSVSFTSAATGVPAPVVQWQESTNGTTWTNINGAVNGTLTFTATTADNNKRYRAVWTNSVGSANSTF